VRLAILCASAGAAVLVLNGQAASPPRPFAPAPLRQADAADPADGSSPVYDPSNSALPAESWGV
jgi:hypothetical protein